LFALGAVVSGTVTFSDGTAGKWALDQYGRLMLDTGKKGYQPSPGDVQVFQRANSAPSSSRHGFEHGVHFTPSGP